MAVKEQVAQQQYGRQQYPPRNEYGVQLRSNLPPGYQPYPQQGRPGAGYSASQQYGGGVPVTTVDVEMLENDPRYYSQRPNSSAIVRRKSYPPVAPPAPLPEPRRFHWLFWIGIIFCIMLVGFIALSALSGFVQQKRDDITYENPRIFQIDQNVGHYGRVSHFVALNLHGYLEIFETQEGHPEVAKIYVPTEIRINPLDPVTLSFQDVTGNGKLDMIISSPSFQAVMFNNGTTFQPQPPTH